MSARDREEEQRRQIEQLTRENDSLRDQMAALQRQLLSRPTRDVAPSTSVPTRTRSMPAPSEKDGEAVPASKRLEQAADKLKDWASEKKGFVGFAIKLMAGLVGALMKVAAKVFKGVGALIEHTKAMKEIEDPAERRAASKAMVGRFFKGLGKAIGDLCGALPGKLGKVAEKVVKGAVDKAAVAVKKIDARVTAAEAAKREENDGGSTPRM